jgi:cytochrome c biogenesis protein CcdA
MENQASSKSFMVNNGIILGIASVLFMLVMYATGNHLTPHWSASIINAILFIGIIIYGIKQFKAANDNFLSWGQGVKIGVGVAIVGGLIVVVYNYLFMNFLEPDFMNQMMEIQNQAFLDQGLTEEQIEAANAMTSTFSSPGIMAAVGIISYAIGGFIVAAIAAAIMKKSEEENY